MEIDQDMKVQVCRTGSHSDLAAQKLTEKGHQTGMTKWESPTEKSTNRRNLKMANTKVAIIAANGTRFDAYKVFNVATAAAASDAEVGIFFTFEGLNLIHKEGHKNLPLPEGKEHFEEGFKQANVPSIEELVGIAQELGIKLLACQMTMDVMNLEKDAFIEGIEVDGAASFIDYAKDANISLTF